MEHIAGRQRVDGADLVAVGVPDFGRLPPSGNRPAPSVTATNRVKRCPTARPRPAPASFRPDAIRAPGSEKTAWVARRARSSSTSRGPISASSTAGLPAAAERRRAAPPHPAASAHRPARRRPRRWPDQRQPTRIGRQRGVVERHDQAFAAVIDDDGAERRCDAGKPPHERCSQPRRRQARRRCAARPSSSPRRESNAGASAPRRAAGSGGACGHALRDDGHLAWAGPCRDHRAAHRRERWCRASPTRRTGCADCRAEAWRGHGVRPVHHAPGSACWQPDCSPASEFNRVQPPFHGPTSPVQEFRCQQPRVQSQVSAMVVNSPSGRCHGNALHCARPGIPFPVTRRHHPRPGCAVSPAGRPDRRRSRPR